MAQDFGSRVSHSRAHALSARFLSVLFLLLSLSGIAHAQSIPPLNVYQTIDDNGVDVSRGTLFVSTPMVSIGQPGLGGLSFGRTFDSSVPGWRDNVTGVIDSSGSQYTVELMGGVELFTLSSGTFSSTQGRGGTLTFNSGTNEYTYTTASGAVAVYDKDLASEMPTEANEGRVTQVTLPSGERLTFTYTKLEAVTPPDPPTFLAHRLQSINNNLGYQLSFEYENNDADASGLNLIEVTAINNAVAYCDPTANGCGLTGWPTLTFGVDGTAETVTDATGLTTRYAFTSGLITGIRWPSSISDDVTISYFGSPSRVRYYTTAAGTWTYDFYPSSPNTTARVYRPGSADYMDYTTVTATGRLNSVTNGPTSVGESYGYDGLGRLNRVYRSDGTDTEYTYDARGNITEARENAVSGSGLSDIVTTAAYDSTCSNPVTCNQPNSITDPRGFRTDYTYSSTHGGVLTVTSPAASGSAPVGSGVRPETRYNYTQLYAYYRQSSGGGVIQAPTAVYRLSGTAACATTSSCANGADETVSSVSYDTTGSLDNVLPTSVTVRAGNSAVSTTSTGTYDQIGNLTETDGPLTNDVTKFVYDDARRRLGVIGPDPDGGGSLLNRALRYDYDGHGWVEAVERGTASGGTWANFSPLERLEVVYDGAGRQIQQRFVAGGSTHAVTQFSYDGAARLECAAVRMNPSEFVSLPASACTLDTEGANGPDRVTRNYYDAGSRLIRIAGAYGTSSQQDTLTQSYLLATNRIGTFTDANGNVTTYEYDGFGRTYRIRFPNASGGGSSATDYEQYTYDANSNVTQDRRRDGATISFAYDNLSRATTMTPSTGDVVSYAYDNFNRMTQAAFTGHTLTFAYDQLSRNISAGGPLGTVTYENDAAGRRTRITWPDSFCAQYAYDLTNAVTQISAEGGGCTTTTLATYTYDNLGRRTLLSRGNGTTTSYDYDSAGRLEELAQNLDSTTNDVSFEFGYNAASQIIDQDRTTSNSGYVWTQPSNSGQDSTANGLNQIAQLSGASFTYDGRGNLTWTGAASYSYDVYNRLTGAGSATLAYDPASRLYQTVGGGGTTRFQYDGVDLIAEYDSSNVLQRRYVHGPGIDEPVVWYEGSGTGDRRWLHQDQAGSVMAVSDSSGALSGSPNTYDEYGVPGSSNVGRFQYTGQTWIPEASRYNYKARGYLAIMGRFAQSDPILYADGMNLYAYVRNDPLNRVDPFGTRCWWTHNPPHPDPSDPENVIVGYGSRRECDWSSFWGIGSGPRSRGGDWQNFMDESNREFTRTVVCNAPSVSAGGAVDAYAGVGGTAGLGVAFDPSTGQLSLTIDAGVGVGASTGTVTRSFQGSAGQSSGGATEPVVSLGLNFNATAAFGTSGVTYSNQLVGSNPGQSSLGATQAAGATVNATVTGHGQVNLPPMWDADCEG